LITDEGFNEMNDSMKVNAVEGIMNKLDWKSTKEYRIDLKLEQS